MHKHILDRPADHSRRASARMIAVQRQAIPRKTTLMLQRRPRTRISEQRVMQFLRLARG